MLTQQQFSRLLDIGNAACHAGAVFEARRIFDGLLAFRPDSKPALIGKALSHIVVDDFAEAEGLLKDQVLAKDPGNVEATALLGLSCLLGGKLDEGRAALAGLQDQDGPAGQLARELLSASA